MKLLFFIFLLFNALRAQGSENFSYSETPEYAKPNLSDILEVETDLQSEGYWPVDLSGEQRLKAFGADQVFFDPYSKKIVILKFGQRVSDSNLLQKVIKLNGDYLYHGTVGDNVPFALYFIEHNEAEARAAVESFGLVEKKTAMSYLIPSAHAASCTDTLAKAVGMVNPLAGVALGAGPQRIFNCGLAALKGAGSSIKGTVNGVANFVRNPGSAWAKAKETVNQLVEFAKHIDSEVKQLSSAIGGLDGATAMQLGCSIAGELIPGLLLGGAAAVTAAKTLPLLIARLKRIAPVLKSVSILNKERKLSNASRTVSGLVMCGI